MSFIERWCPLCRGSFSEVSLYVSVVNTGLVGEFNFVLDVSDYIQVRHAWFHHQYVSPFTHISILYTSTQRIVTYVVLKSSTVYLYYLYHSSDGETS